MYNGIINVGLPKNWYRRWGRSVYGNISIQFSFTRNYDNPPYRFMNTISIINIPPQDWDAALLHGTTSSLKLYHTSFWADRLVELLQYVPRYITVSNETGKVLFRLTVFEAPDNVSGTFGHFFGKKRKKMLWYGQPVSYNDPGQSDYSFLAQTLNNLMNTEHAQLISGEWPVRHKSAVADIWKQRHWATLTIDLTRSTDELYGSLKPAARKAIKKAIRDTVVVEQIRTLDELRQYYIFAEACAKRYHKKMFGVDDFLTMWKHIKKGGIYETFIAKKEGELLSGLSIWGYGDTIGELGSFQSERSFAEKLYGQDLIKWHIMQWAKNNTISYFDLAGIDPNPVDEKTRNIRLFKEKWGGTYSEFLMLHG